MRTQPSIRAVLLSGLVALLMLPVGFGVAQAVQEQPPGESLHLDPNPSSDPVAMGNRLKAAQTSGDTAELDRVTEEIRDEILSRLDPEERAAAESAPPEPSVPEGTVAYIPPSMPSVLIDDCAERVSDGKATALCELVVLHAEGRVRSGAFSAEEITEILSKQTAGEGR